jgi:hypothetical protein
MRPLSIGRALAHAWSLIRIPTGVASVVFGGETTRSAPSVGVMMLPLPLSQRTW